MSARTPLIARPGRGLLVGLMVIPVVAAALGLGTGIAATVGTAAPAEAQCAPRLAVSMTTGLAAGGETLTVSGSCYDVNKGIYVAFCVVPPPGAKPSPCGGGVDMSGAGGLSHWISSNPPPNGVGLAVPYGPGGSFTVTMRPSATLNATVDCRRVSCAIVTRNDHTRQEDRSQDVVVPLTFAAAPTPTTAAPVVPAPTTAPPTTAAPETTTTTTVEPATTTTAVEAVTTADTAPDEEEDAAQGEELDVAPASSDGGSGGSGGVVVVVLSVVVLAAAIGSGWYAVRRRRLVGGPGGAA